MWHRTVWYHLSLGRWPDVACVRISVLLLVFIDITDRTKMTRTPERWIEQACYNLFRVGFVMLPWIKHNRDRESCSKPHSKKLRTNNNRIGLNTKYRTAFCMKHEEPQTEWRHSHSVLWRTHRCREQQQLRNNWKQSILFFFFFMQYGKHFNIIAV